MQVNSINSALRTSNIASTTNKTSGVNIAITPNENNVKTGDKSDNKATVAVTTPNKSGSVEIGREQAVNSYVRHTQINMLKDVSNINSGASPLTLYALNNSDIDSSDISNLATVNSQKKMAETYVETTKQINNSQESSGPTNPTEAQDLYKKASSAYIKHSLFFAGVDKASSGFTTKA